MIGIFINISLVFLFIRFFFVEIWKNYGKSQMLSYFIFICYTGMLISLQFTYGQDVISKRCSYPYKQIDQFKLLLYILFPNLMIFMLMFAILKILPGWKAPFSNTFGYFLAYTMGINKTFSSLLAKKGENDNINNSIDQIAGNKSLMINQFTVDNFAETFNEFHKNKLFFVEGYEPTNIPVEFVERINSVGQKEEIQKLFSAVSAKDLVAEHIWYILTGCLVITIVQNTMGELNCNLLNLGNQN
jgi:hypothetical protein